MQIEFEKKLTALGLSYSVHPGGFYIISFQQEYSTHLIVKLVSSLPVNRHIYGSKNGNTVHAIGRFEFILPSSRRGPHILSFAFRNAIKNQVQFLIIPTKEFLRRQARVNARSIHRKNIVVVIWQMEDGFVYDTTNISSEGEWFFLSKSVNGRIADGTELDYSDYLNGWQRITAR